MLALRSIVPLVTAVLVSLSLSSGVHAQVAGQGSPLVTPANYQYGCETRWAFPGPGQTAYQPITIGPSTCTIWQSGTTTANSHLVPGTGTVTTARVRSGPNPAPISIATIRRYFKPNQQNQMEYVCCQGISTTPVVQPTPNGVTEIPVNLIVMTQQPENGQTGYWDIVAVNVHGPGSLPMAELGPHEYALGSNPPNATWQYPMVAPNDSNMNTWDAPNFEVLMQFDWCPKIAGTRAVAAPRAGCASASAGPGVTPGPSPVPTTPSPSKPKAPAAVSSAKLKMARNGRVAVGIRCQQSRRCQGAIRLRLGKRVLARGSIAIKAGGRATVRMTVAGKERRRVTRKGVKVVVDVDLGKAGKVTRTVTLRR